MKKQLCKYVAALLLFGSNGIVASYIHLTSYHIVLLRTLLGSLTLLLLFFVTGHRFSFYRHRTDCLLLAVSGIAMGGSWMFLYEAYTQVGVGIASLLYDCGPVLVMALSPVLFGERLTGGKLGGFAAVLCGVFLINAPSEGAPGGFGILCGLLSAALYAVMVIANKKTKAIMGMENALLQLFFSFLTVAVFVGVKNGGFAMPLTVGDVFPILLLGLINTGIGCYLYFSSIGELPVQTVSICGYAEPLSALLLAALLLGETLQPLQMLGAALLLGGAVFAECFHPQRKA